MQVQVNGLFVLLCWLHDRVSCLTFFQCCSARAPVCTGCVFHCWHFGVVFVVYCISRLIVVLFGFVFGKLVFSIGRLVTEWERNSLFNGVSTLTTVKTQTHFHFILLSRQTEEFSRYSNLIILSRVYSSCLVLLLIN